MPDRTSQRDRTRPEAAGRTTPSDAAGGQSSGLVRAGRAAWALLGILVLLGGALYLTGQVMLLVVPLVLALFPAALLEPVSRWLKAHRVPPALASLLTIVGSILLIAGLIAALVPLVLADLPDLIEAGEQGLGQLQTFLDEDPMGLGIGGAEELLDQAQEAVGEFGEVAGQALEALVTVFEAAAAILFLLVALFFYLKDDRQIARGIGDLLPPSIRTEASEIAGRIWGTLGGFFRGQLLVALVDAIFIGLGLVLLGIPLALPLSVLIFFGGLFPIIGAFVTGTLAVLVALADGGLLMGLVVLGLIIAVQQLESNVLEPVVLGRVISLHPLLIIVAVTGGALTLGILGAFLAVPIVASIARTVEYLRERRYLTTSGEETEAEEGDGERRQDVEAASGERRAAAGAARGTEGEQEAATDGGNGKRRRRKRRGRERAGAADGAKAASPSRRAR